MIAHVGAVPVEETLPALVATVLLARGWLMLHLRGHAPED